MRNGQGKSPVSEFLAEHETGLGIESLQNKLQRYGAGKTRALDMADYITDFQTGKGKVGHPTEEQKQAKRIVSSMRECGGYLVFRNYFEIDEVRLAAACFCKKHLLCPFCAMRRGAKYLQVYHERLQLVLAENPRLRAFMVTLTVKDGEDLSERFTHLRSCLKRYQEQRRNANKGQKFVEYAKALGGVFSIEVKRGSGSGLWHPHVHMIWLCENEPDSVKLSQEWHTITGDSYIVDVREFYGETVIDGFLEVFKYALKFSDMPHADNWEAFKTLSGKRLVDNFGLFRGVVVPDKLTDDQYMDKPYISMLYRFVRGSGYNFIGQGTDNDVMTLLNSGNKSA